MTRIPNRERRFDRRSFLAGLGAAAFAGGFVAEAARAAELNAPRRVDALPDGARPALTVAHCCDPQIGFAAGIDDREQAYAADLARLKREIAKINELRPDVAVFCGDMTNRCNERGRDWPELLKTFEVPVLFAPGNHDIPDPVKADAAAAYREVFGPEMQTLNVKGWKLVAANTQYCREGADEALRAEAVSRFTSELDKSRETGTPTILATHVPPFVKKLDEADEYFNIPSEIRRDYLNYCLASGVKFYLAGHTHTTL
ncbi:MAG: metallophosphoesterase, partial [Thermoguttaceae bacterium]|nr:metallophosphoesterase [Thermoguttaceae bacterium]